jgi:hypothetical protein
VQRQESIGNPDGNQSAPPIFSPGKPMALVIPDQ